MDKPSITISVDCGGTFTDAVAISGDKMELFKIPTTPHDLTVGFFQVIDEIAKAWDMPPEDLLIRTLSIKFATTIGTNTIIQKSGPKIGLFLTKGTTEEVFSQDNIALKDFLPETTVAEISEAVDSEGTVKQTPDENGVIEKVEALLDNGARRIVVSLKNADVNPTNENEIKRIVEESYPKHSLGSVPILLSTQVTTRQGYIERTNTAFINSYLHTDMARFLYKAQNRLARQRFRYPLLIGHAGGGVARVAKSQAINTYNSGPAAGVFSSQALTTLYPRIRNFITADLGGTSLDLGFILEHQLSHELKTKIGGLPCHVYMVEVANLGIGGGSIASLSPERVKVGPRSAGAAPGPACYDLGGVEPTVTDCDLVLGYIDPDYFLGGKFKLSPEKANQAVNDFLAEPMGISVEEAAESVRKQAATEMKLIVRQSASKMHGVEPESCTLVAFGGAGPTHCCSFADACGMKRIIVPKLASAFSAYGLSLMDILHVYEENWINPVGSEDLAEGAKCLLSRALSDMRGEGFASEDVDIAILLMGKEQRINLALPGRGKNIDQWERIVTESVLDIQVPSDIRSLVLMVSSQIATQEIPECPLNEADPKEAFVERRQIYCKGKKLDMPVYSRAKLVPGNEILGPAIVEAPETTYVIEDSWRLFIDTYDNALVTKELYPNRS